MMFAIWAAITLVDSMFSEASASQAVFSMCTTAVVHWKVPGALHGAIRYGPAERGCDMRNCTPHCSIITSAERGLSGKRVDWTVTYQPHLATCDGLCVP